MQAGHTSSLNITASSQPGSHTPTHANQSEAFEPAPRLLVLHQPTNQPAHTPLHHDQPCFNAAFVTPAQAAQTSTEAPILLAAETQSTPAEDSAGGAWSAIKHIVNQVSPPEQVCHDSSSFHRGESMMHNCFSNSRYGTYILACRVCGL